MRFVANMDMKNVADSDTLIVLFSQNVKMADVYDFWSSDTRFAAFSSASKGLDKDIKVIYAITFEGDPPAEKRASAFKVKRRDMHFLMSIDTLNPVWRIKFFFYRC